MILLYHGIVPDGSPSERWQAGRALTQTAFERQMRWLADHCQLVSLPEYLDLATEQRPSKRKPVAITLDDGFDITFRCAAPVLAELRIPATIFVSTAHLEGGELLWFSYLKALCFECQYAEVRTDQHAFPLETKVQRQQAWDQLRSLAKTSGDPSEFCERLSEEFPLAPDVKSLYAGMTHKQIKVAGESDYLEVGAHTVTHPYLSQLSKTSQEKEILDGKDVLARLTGKEIRYFAYPGGEYNADTLDVVKTAGFKAAFAVIPQKIGGISELEIGRIGIYSPSLLKLQMKIAGFADLGRWIGFRVG